MLSKDFRALLTNNRVELVDTISLTVKVWAGLVAKCVVTDEEKEKITVCKPLQKLLSIQSI